MLIYIVTNPADTSHMVLCANAETVKAVQQKVPEVLVRSWDTGESESLIFRFTDPREESLIFCPASPSEEG